MPIPQAPVSAVPAAVATGAPADGAVADEAGGDGAGEVLALFPRGGDAFSVAPKRRFLLQLRHRTDSGGTG